MATAGEFRSEAWLESPVSTEIGELQLAGALRNVPGIDRRDMRVLGSFAIVYMVAADGYYCDARGVSRGLASGDLVVIFPEIAHAYGPRDGRPWDQIYFVFDGPQFAFWRRRGLLDPARPVLHLEPVDYWRHRLAEVINRAPAVSAGAALRTMGRFLHLLGDMLAAGAEPAARTGRDAWLEKSLRLLADRDAAGWRTPRSVARAVGLSYDNFRKQFSAQLGVSPGQYVKRKRIDWACAAIYQAGRSFKEIAEELGFCDVFHFSKAFKQVVGCTPSEFRKKMRGR